MTVGKNFRQPASKILAVCFGAYIGVFGLPGFTGQDQARVSQHIPAAKQKLKTSRLYQIAGDLFARGAAKAEGPELLEKKELNWNKTIKKGETPVGSIIDGAYIEDGEVKEKEHPLPDLSGFKKIGAFKYDTLDEVPGKETVIVKYEEKDDPQHQIWIGAYRDKIACYFHSNPEGDKNWGGRGTYQPDRNFEQKQGTKWPDFWHNLKAFFPEHY